MAPPSMPPLKLIALISGPDRPGIVARVSGWIFEHGGNILHADQHTDAEEGLFIQRLEWTVSPSDNPEAMMEEFGSMLHSELGMTGIKLLRADRRLRVVLMVSKIPHCFHDFLIRWKLGELPCDLKGIISNHPDFRSETEAAGLPFHHVPVTAANKREAENRQLEIIRSCDAELILMARYMQVLSPEFIHEAQAPIINIHHSFLPAFTGARPYHQAFSRGVKIIGATAHYATETLDEGPIIAQNVEPISHRHTVEDLKRIGRDLECQVFAKAIRLHLEHRIITYSNKTVVFD